MLLNRRRCHYYTLLYTYIHSAQSFETKKKNEQKLLQYIIGMRVRRVRANIFNRIIITECRSSFFTPYSLKSKGGDSYFGSFSMGFHVFFLSKE